MKNFPAYRVVSGNFLNKEYRQMAFRIAVELFRKQTVQGLLQRSCIISLIENVQEKSLFFAALL